MRLVVQAAPMNHLAWLAERAGCVLTADFRAIEAVDARGSIRGMVGFHHWTPNAVVMDVAVATPAAVRALLRPAFSYPFEQMGVGLALCAVASNNARALKFVGSLGFEEKCSMRDAFGPGVDLVWHELRRQNCRWLRKAA